MGLSALALAKPVSLQWSPLKHAIQYELVVRKADTEVVHVTLPGDHTQWQGELPFGFFTYQIRALDFTGRPGDWTVLLPLVVMPPSPELVGPRSGEIVTWLYAKDKLTLRWKRVPGADKYGVRVLSGDSEIFERTVGATECEVTGLVAGSYRWTVETVVEGAKGRQWKGRASPAGEFQLRYHSLVAPSGLEPRGARTREPEETVRLRWSPVELAQGYEVRAWRVDAATRGRAAERLEAPPDESRLVDTPYADLSFPTDGNFVWAVRAVARPDATGAAAVKGRFTFARLKLSSARLGEVGVSGALAPYTYTVTGPLASARLSGSSAIATRITLGAEYWPAPRWGLWLDAAALGWAVGDASFVSPSLGVGGGARFLLGPDTFGWQLLPRLGLGLRGYKDTRPLPSSANDPTPPSGADPDSPSAGAAGLTAGVDLRYQWSWRWAAGVKLSGFVPFVAWESGLSGVQLHTNAIVDNLDIGVYGIYWFHPRWGAKVGLAHANRSLGFTSGGEAYRLEMGIWSLSAGLDFLW